MRQEVIEARNVQHDPVFGPCCAPGTVAGFSSFGDANSLLIIWRAGSVNSEREMGLLLRLPAWDN